MESIANMSRYWFLAGMLSTVASMLNGCATVQPISHNAQSRLVASETIRLSLPPISHADIQKGTEVDVIGTTQRDGKTYRVVKIADPAAMFIGLLIDDSGNFEGSGISLLNGSKMGWNYKAEPASAQLVPLSAEHPLANSNPLDTDDAQKQAQAVMENVLKDPYSAHWLCSSPRWGTVNSGKAWGGEDVTGWILPCAINSKNSYGAYIGATQYVFVFVDQKLRRVAELGGSGLFATQRVVYDN